MNIIIGGPGSGKTKEILRLSAENRIPVLCESQARLERLLVKAKGYGFSIPTPIVYTQVDNEVKEVYVDDVERLLEVMFNCKINTITFNATSDSKIVDLDKNL